MTFDKTQYAPDWPDISLAIRERAQDRCEVCGVPNGAEILRSADDPIKYLYVNAEGVHCTPGGSWIKLSEIPDEYLLGDYVVIVLTVAHLDQNTRNDDPENLKALCQRCHLNHDRPHNLVKAKRTRLENKRRATLDSGQLPLLD